MLRRWLQRPALHLGSLAVMVVAGLLLTLWVSYVYTIERRAYASDEATWAPLDAERQLTHLLVPLDVLDQTGTIDEAAYQLQRDLTLNSLDVLFVYARANPSFTAEQAALVTNIERDTQIYEQRDAALPLDRRGAEERLVLVSRAITNSHRLANMRRQVAEAANTRSIRRMRVASYAQLGTLVLLVVAVGLSLWYRRVSNRRSREAQHHAEELAMEQERLRISRDVHDTIGHSLDAINMHLAAARAHWTKHPTTALHSVVVAHESGRAARQEVRKAVAAVKESALTASIDDLLRAPIRICHLAGIDAELVVEGEPRAISEVHKQVLYRVTQEALNNVRSHSQATIVIVRLTYQPNHIQLIIEDNGTGKESTSTSGSGLAGMQQRVARVNGVLTIQAQGPGKGYHIEVLL